MSPNRSVAGMVVNLPEQAQRLSSAAAEACAVLAQRGYGKIDVPVIEPVEPFLLRSGEVVRRSMYVFEDPGGHEVCLRPEMTIPVIRAFAAHMTDRPRPLRLFYDGPVFRHRPAAAGRPRQERQVGAELIGAEDRLAADAEIISTAIAAIDAIGCNDAVLALSDFSLVGTLIDALDLPQHACRRLINLLNHPAALQRAISDEEPQEPALPDALAQLEREQGVQLVLKIISGMPLQQVGQRDPRRIAERFWDTQIVRSSFTLDNATRKLLRDVSSICGSPQQALRSLAKITATFADEICQPLERLERLIEMIDKAVGSGERLLLDFGLSRPFAYYSGMIFELRRGERVIGGGGRYDPLVKMIDPRLDVDAVGFAVSLQGALAIDGEEG
ncbi:MAG: ATP phosphoribosyltransferase regulatory subunit [Candidatus Alcyoniella australis]|nr:ATP phosphoribosyltransferase regulatory subunit [Candidatus Alcyoniella australis]